MGNFNEILSPQDKLGGSTRTETLIDAFRQTLNHCQLSLLDFIGINLTWGNKNPDGRNIKERIDWVMANSVCMVEHLDFYKSGQRALRVNLVFQSMSTTTQQSRFCFEALWLDEPESYEIIESVWKHPVGQGTLEQVVANIDSGATSLTKWYRDKFGGFK
ncbi:hypothetical protein PanWU01x14_123540 [Parasponia andersonii]|uniref:Endonuclease/exonuclease/phosphatase n=1 Tax=Parasponia andersonii TaxID=3476 RepID=A0A2P5CUB7_PARAD|nr:hypothetical protein PanWU01x14_123540 [Parasponia andersonii]